MIRMNFIVVLDRAVHASTPHVPVPMYVITGKNFTNLTQLPSLTDFTK
jgi:hypothetical protein